MSYAPPPKNISVCFPRYRSPDDIVHEAANRCLRMRCGVERYHLRGEGSPPEVFCASSVAQWVHVDEPAVALLVVLAQCANFVRLSFCGAACATGVPSSFRASHWGILGRL